jgi:uncharacterized protein
MAFNIWRITDGKAGHDSQSIGLCNAIERLKACKRFDIPVDSLLNNCKNILLNQFPSGRKLPDPDIIIGAGHQTHLPMLSAKHTRKGKIIVLMKPGLPLSFFDCCIIPKHDSPPRKENIISTSGALNPVRLNENKSVNTGLILIGGPSKHYQWNDKSIVNQIKQIITNDTNIHWTIADSPRTPKTTLATVNGLACKNVKVLNFAETDSKTIREFIFRADNIWVSADSVSMIYESLSSGAAVGLLDLVQEKKNRVANAINILINEKQLITFAMWNNTHQLTKASFKFNEAERCASLLLERGMLD